MAWFLRRGSAWFHLVRQRSARIVNVRHRSVHLLLDNDQRGFNFRQITSQCRWRLHSRMRYSRQAQHSKSPPKAANHPFSLHLPRPALTSGPADEADDDTFIGVDDRKTALRKRSRVFVKLVEPCGCVHHQFPRRARIESWNLLPVAAHLAVICSAFPTAQLALQITRGTTHKSFAHHRFSHRPSVSPCEKSDRGVC
jgi:hypothetical protein